MKKLIALAVVGVVAGLLAFYGRDALDLYRLVDHIDTANEAHEADGGPWPRLSDACVGCHGAQGKSRHQGYPSLAGQPAAYLTNQLRNFASGERANPNMGPLAKTLSEDEVQQLAQYFAKQTAEANIGFNADPVLREKGRSLAEKGGCAACHGAELMGHDPFPRLAGQGQLYLKAQLDAFAEGRRKDPSGAMGAILSALSADDRLALSHYLAALAPVVK